MRLVFWAGFWAFITDQASKFLVLNALNLREVLQIDVLPPLLRFHMAWNDGINFGLFSGSPEAAKWVLVALAMLICGYVLYWMRKDPPGKWGMISAGLLIGGALGNVVDRLLFGAVVDFLNMSCCGIDNPYAFNVADIWIFAGAIGLILFTSGKKREA
ncbi:signal peptidase II [Shimia sp. R9_2]|uniref:signal peptidase II n=1 Tax=Shimia sp. R9_2 TaxID=2821112 RepID=UPI001ADAB1D8|nr:signal peptidase II [Shimia sp. R9_2]MBO9395630.1 signal peptidase II [Shimia sp. R9_2]